MITYVKGDATCPIGAGRKIICHCLSDTGAHDAGFALAIARKWPKAVEVYRKSHMDLGAAYYYEADPELTIAMVIGQIGLGPRSLALSCLSAGLEEVAIAAIETGSSVHMPRIGCGLAGGKWEDVEPIILRTFDLGLTSFIPVTIYDLP